MKYRQSDILKITFSCLILLFLGLSNAPVTHAEAYTYITGWGSSGYDDGYFRDIEGVAIDSSGNIYVADTGNNRIQKFNSTGAFITKWGSKGSGSGKFNRPCDVAVDSSGNFYVADYANNRIQKFNSSGTFLTAWILYYGYYYNPEGVAIDSLDNVYVTSIGCILKFNSNGTLLTKWDIIGTPRGVAVDSSGNVYVADTYNNRIQKFDSSGTFLTEWGSKGSDNGQFYYPWRVAVDSSGNIYATDFQNNRIQKFDCNGTFVTKWNSSKYPRGIAVNPSGNVVYVSSVWRNIIEKFAKEKVIPTVTWNNPADIVYGTALNSTQLNATASYNRNQVFGTFVYNPPEGTTLDVGTHKLYVDFTPIDAANYTTASKNVTINVLKDTPTITWNNPADIVYGTALNDTQLNATASVPGSFVYTPPSGTKLDVGTQTLHADFTPIDTTNYTTASKNVTINVLENDDLKTFKVVSIYYKCYSWSNKQYPLINLSGENHVPLLADNDPIWKCHVDKLAKFVLDNNYKYTLKTGDKLDLGSGYALEAKQVDVDGKKVWLELSKGGQYIDDAIVSTDTSDKTWTCILDNIQGENNIPVLKVHVNQIFQGAVDSVAQIDGIWLIDYANATTFKVGDQFENLTLMQINYGVNESDLGSLVFENATSLP